VYAAQSGYVYHYYAVAKGEHEFTFEVTHDMKMWMAVTVTLDAAGLAEWERGQQRVLRDQERYALAKMALFAAFDERAGPPAMREPVHAGLERMAEMARTLNL
jgi:hypothetical protein